MNILNLASILGHNVPLSALSLCDKILERLYEICPRLVTLIDREDCGDGILEAFEAVSIECKNKLLVISLVTVLESQIVINDVTLHRSSSDYKAQEGEVWPKRIVTIGLTIMFFITLYYLAYYVFILKTNGEKLDGLVYQVLAFLYKVIKPLIL